MNHKLLENNYLIIPNFIFSYRANNLKEEFKEFCEKNNSKGDDQAPNSHSDYNYISFLELLCEKVPEISEILEETVLPTYVYSRVYKKGSVLTSHTDRDACEISLTLHLGGDESWPIWIKTPDGQDKCVKLNPGDAMMYLGCIAEHWRDEYLGNEYVQVFLHYVRSRGEKSYAYFDKIKSISDNKTDQEKQNIVEPPRLLPQQESLTTISSQNKLEDFIEIFDDVIPESVCDEILNEYINSDEWSYAQTGSGENINIRNCKEIGMSLESVIQKNLEIRRKLDKTIFSYVNKSMNLYQQKHSSFQIDIDTGYQLLQYNEGQYYIQHTDSFKEQQRSVSCSIQLNDNYDGGEFAFFNREMMIRSKKGSVIMFPSNFMFPHEIMPVIKGTRYSIVTWLV
jgi:hypothetical protein